MKTYQEVMAHCEANSFKTFDTTIARKFIYKRLKGSGMRSDRCEERADELIQAAFLRWIKAGGNLSPASCIIFEDRRLAAKEKRYGEVCSYVALAMKHEAIDPVTADELLEADQSLTPTMEMIQGYLNDDSYTDDEWRESHSLLYSLMSGTPKKQIAEELGISRPTLYARIKRLQRDIERRTEMRLSKAYSLQVDVRDSLCDALEAL